MAKIVDIVDRAAAKPKLDEVASWERSLYSLAGRGGVQRYNPDLLVGRLGLQIYAKMRNDEQVKAVMQFKRDAVTGRGWFLKFDESSSLSKEEQAKRIRIITRCLNSMTGSFEDGLNKVATGRDYGFSLTEKVYQEVKSDDGVHIGLRMLLGRDPRMFIFHTDEYGILKECIQQLDGKTQTINLSKFVYYVHNPEFDQYFGRSDLREAYRAWYIKERIGDFWALYLERFAGGFMVITQTEDSQLVYGTPAYTSLQDVILNMHGSTGIILPKGVQAAMMFPPANDQFKVAIEFQDLAIAKACLMPNLLGLSNSGNVGAYAQSQTQLEAFIWTLNADARRLEACIQEQLVDDLCAQNFGDNNHPQFGFRPASIEHLKWVIETWVKMAAGKVVLSTEQDEATLRKMLDMPERKPEDEPLVDPVEEAKLAIQKDQMAADAATNQQDTANQKEDAVVKRVLHRLQFGWNPDQVRDETGKWTGGGPSVRMTDHLERELSADKSPAAREAADNIDNLDAMSPEAKEATRKALQSLIDHTDDERTSGKDRSEAKRLLRQHFRWNGRQRTLNSVSDGTELTDGRLSAVPHGELRGCTLEQFTMATQRVMFSVIERRQDDIARSTTEAAAFIVARAVKRLLGNEEQLATLTDSNVEDIAAMELSSNEKSKLNALYRRGLGDMWSTGISLARNEIDRARGTNRQKFTDLRDKAAAYFETGAFRMAGNVSDAVRSMIQQELMNAVKFGYSPTQTREVIWDRLVAKGLTARQVVKQVETDDAVMQALDELWVDSEEAAAHYLDTLARTNLYEAMNEARFAEFTDPELGGFVKALTYSAILDERTTDICAELDDKTFAADSDVWDKYRPPNHFNCRSVLVPITEVDGWDGVEDEEPTIDPAVGFGPAG